MTPLHITMNLARQPWADLTERHPVLVPLERIGLLPGGTAAGRPTVEMMATLNGRAVIVQATYRTMRTALRCFAATPDGLATDAFDELGGGDDDIVVRVLP